MLAYPVILSQLGHVMMGVVDNVMVGHVGARQLAAAGLANVIFNVFMLFGIGVSYAITPLVAEADGEKDENKIVATFRHGLVINVVVALLLMMVVFFGKNILYQIGQPDDVIVFSIPYLEIVMWSLLPIMIFQSFRQFSEGLSNTWIPMVIVILANGVNVLFNYAFIYGEFGFTAMGLQGAGIATLTSRIFMALALAATFLFAPEFKKYKAIFLLRDFSRSLFRRMLHLGVPAGVQFIFEVAAFDFSLVMMGWLGADALAAHQIAINLATVSYMTTSGLAAAATIRVSHALGQDDIALARRYGFILLGMALTLMLTWALAFISLNAWLPKLYVDEASVIAMARPLIIIAGLFQLSDGTQVVCIGALRGLQDVKVPSLFIFISYWIIGLPLGYWLGFHTSLGAVGIWIGLLIGLSLTATAMFFRFNALTRQPPVFFKSKEIKETKANRS